MMRSIRGAVLLLCGLSSLAIADDRMMYDTIGDGYATFRVDEYGSMWGCGDGVGFVGGTYFNPLVDDLTAPGGEPVEWLTGLFGEADNPGLEYSQASCAAAVYVFDVRTRERQMLRDKRWAYHPEFDPYVGNPAAAARPSDVLQNAEFLYTDDSFYSNDGFGFQHRESQFALAGMPDVEVELEQTVCGSVLYQEYTYSVTGSSPRRLAVSRVDDADLEWGPAEYGSNYLNNFGKGLTLPDDPYTKVMMWNVTGDVTYSLEMFGDAMYLGWRLWQCNLAVGASTFGAGASEFARMNLSNWWDTDQLHTAMKCAPPKTMTVPAWWDMPEVDTGLKYTEGALDTAIGVQGLIFLTPGHPQKLTYVTELSPGADPSPWSVSGTSTPASVPQPSWWSTTESLITPVTIDVHERIGFGCGVSCAITGVTSNQPMSHGGYPGGDYYITGDLTLELKAKADPLVELSAYPWEHRVYDVEVTCTDYFGTEFVTSVAVPVGG
jgi:hypothetical protein